MFPLAILGLINLSSCTKVVQIDLNSSNPRYVIEANISNIDSLQTVHISRTVNFSNTNDYPGVANAIVVLSDDQGNSDSLTQAAQPGFYQSGKIKGVPGRKYQLRVLVDGHQFTASTKMPDAIMIDSMEVIEQLSFGKQIKSPKVTFKENPEEDNYYYFILHRNNQRLKTIYIDNDQSLNGNVVNRILPDMDSSFNSGDRVRVELQSISKEVYDYYYSLGQTIGQSSATPANPISNIKGENVLGYFSAHTAHRVTLIVP